MDVLPTVSLEDFKNLSEQLYYITETVSMETNTQQPGSNPTVQTIIIFENKTVNQ